MLSYRIEIRLKPGVADPQGAAVLTSLGHLGYKEVSEARIGKIIDITLNETDEAKAEARLKKMCDDLLANTVIEEYTVRKG